MDTHLLSRFSIKEDVVQKTTLNALSNKIIALTRLPNNWDGYGAIPPNELVNSQLNIFLKLLPEKLLAYTTDEEMYPTPYGTIVLDFRKGENELTMEFGEQAYGFFTDFKNHKNVKIKRAMYKQNEISNELAEAINSLYQTRN